MYIYILRNTDPQRRERFDFFEERMKDLKIISKVFQSKSNLPSLYSVLRSSVTTVLNIAMCQAQLWFNLCLGHEIINFISMTAFLTSSTNLIKTLCKLGKMMNCG